MDFNSSSIMLQITPVPVGIKGIKITCNIFTINKSLVYLLHNII